MPYTIKDMAEMSGLPASTLRYYDKQGLLPNLRRDSNNIRLFSDEDYSRLLLIECLKKSGLSIKDIKSFIDMTERGDEALNERLAIFTNRREILKKRLEELNDVLSVIEYKCWYYGRATEAGTENVVRNLKMSEIPEQFRRAREQLHKTINLDRINKAL